MNSFLDAFFVAYIIERVVQSLDDVIYLQIQILNEAIIQGQGVAYKKRFCIEKESAVLFVYYCVNVDYALQYKL